MQMVSNFYHTGKVAGESISIYSSLRYGESKCEATNCVFIYIASHKITAISYSDFEIRILITDFGKNPDYPFIEWRKDS